MFLGVKNEKVLKQSVGVTRGLVHRWPC